jgi:hypothetical protein
MLDFVDAALFHRFRMIFTDLNRSFSPAWGQLSATILKDDIEHTALEPGRISFKTLLLEHIDWRRGVEVFTRLRPATCGIIVQENPRGITSAVTPGRRIPPSIAEAIEIAHPTLVPIEDLLAAFEDCGYKCRSSYAQRSPMASDHRALLCRQSPLVGGFASRIAGLPRNFELFFTQRPIYRLIFTSCQAGSDTFVR